MGTLPTCENDEDYLLLRSNLSIPADLNGPLSGDWLDSGPAAATFFGQGSSDEEDMCDDEEEEEDDREGDEDDVVTE